MEKSEFGFDPDSVIYSKQSFKFSKLSFLISKQKRVSTSSFTGLYEPTMNKY